MQHYAVSFVDSISEIGQETWNALSGTDNPFTRFEFLHALEDSACISAATGWAPQHVVVKRVEPGLDETVAVMPLYRKNNSWGEYVFDWSWANAYESHGLDYYPKFVTSIPFTPSTGKRIFIQASEDSEAIIAKTKNAIEELADRTQASGWHVLFPEQSQQQAFSQAGMMTRSACQFHWFNRGYENFDDFLATLASRKRKNLRKERQRVAAAGISFRHLSGEEIDTALWQDFYAFYQSTYLMRGMKGYLNPGFFHALSETMAEQLFMVCAYKEQRLIAAALFFRSSDTLFGRYWGSAQDFQFLHFETCYYQGQDYAIAEGLQRFDSGAQGEHKIQRGFEPVTTWSSHWIANPDFAAAIARFVEEESGHIDHYQQQAESLLPFRQGD
jgi:predicted N-acyltransferase